VKKYVSTIIFISIIVISVLMGVRQYKNDESLKSKENEPQTEVSWAFIRIMMILDWKLAY